MIVLVLFTSSHSLSLSLDKMWILLELLFESEWWIRINHMNRIGNDSHKHTFNWIFALTFPRAPCPSLSLSLCVAHFMFILTLFLVNIFFFLSFSFLLFLLLFFLVYTILIHRCFILVAHRPHNICAIKIGMSLFN